MLARRQRAALLHLPPPHGGDDRGEDLPAPAREGGPRGRRRGPGPEQRLRRVGAPGPLRRRRRARGDRGSEFCYRFLQWFDLTKPQALPKADWVMSLEVGEHVPHALESMVFRQCATTV